MKNGWICLLIVCTALAGCSGGEEPQQQKNSNVTIDEGGKEIPLEEGTGAVRAHVLDDLNRSLPGARVSLLGTPHFSDTGPKGTVLFSDVAPGTYPLQIAAEGFRTHMEDIDVLAGNVTNVTVFLLPVYEAGPGYRPHQHDLWAGQTETTLADTTLDLTGPEHTGKGCDYGGVDPLPGKHTLWMYYANRNITSGARAVQLPQEHDDGRPNLVYQGATEVQVTMTWDTTTTNADHFKLYWRAADGTEGWRTVTSGNTVSITVNASLADNSHQSFTLWQFWVHHDNEVASPTSYEPRYMVDSLDVLIQAFRGGDPILEPAHPTFWGDNTTVTLLPEETKTSSSYPDYSRATAEFRPSRIVAPGTGTIIAYFTWQFHNQVDAATHGTYHLYWRSADQNPMTTGYDAYQHIAPVDSGQEGDVYWQRYEIPVEKEQTDAFYQSSSNWAFTFASEGEEENGCDRGLQNGREWSLSLWAVKAPDTDVL